jgi:dTDP-4-dehydrorhamnose 3,5-epimerase
MKILETSNPDVLIIQPRVFEDDRGFFMETYQEQKYFDAGLDYHFVQDNHSSSKRWTLRGLHYQIYQTQGKLVRVGLGEIFDVAVDLRKNSLNFGKWVGAYLSAENKHQFWIPPGFAHGFLVLSEEADVLYKATDYYNPQAERCIQWNDPDISIEWPLPADVEPVISTKDLNGTSFKDSEVFL